MDFFPKDYLLIIDESHVTVSQIGAMYAGDRSRKTTLVEHGFRLPSALDNRPLNSTEFETLVNQCTFVSATPGPTEISRSAVVAEQIIRPTGLIDPAVTIKPLKGQIDDLIEQCRARAEKHERVLVTTLTKRTSEDLTDYLREVGIRVKYLHSEIDAIERVEVLRGFRAADFDVLVGINLLREGLDLPEMSLVAILDADKEGFLRSATSLIQTAGRAARHINAAVILYADVMTDSIKKFLQTTEYRRTKQLAYNKEHGITPKTVKRELQLSLADLTKARAVEASVVREAPAATRRRSCCVNWKRRCWRRRRTCNLRRRRSCATRLTNSRRANPADLPIRRSPGPSSGEVRPQIEGQCGEEDASRQGAMTTLPPEIIRNLVVAALAEDIGAGDITTEAAIPAEQRAEACIVAKEPCVVAGLPLVEAVFTQIDRAVAVKLLVEEGDAVEMGTRVCELRGPARGILTGERTALNFLQRLSGIATLTHQFVAKVAQAPVRVKPKILDTRKTTPTLRILEKYAVAIGGGTNHRMGLFDAVMIKDNHRVVLARLWFEGPRRCRCFGTQKTSERANHHRSRQSGAG